MKEYKYTAITYADKIIKIEKIIDNQSAITTADARVIAGPAFMKVWNPQIGGWLVMDGKFSSRPRYYSNGEFTERFEFVENAHV